MFCRLTVPQPNPKPTSSLAAQKIGNMRYFHSFLRLRAFVLYILSVRCQRFATIFTSPGCFFFLYNPFFFLATYNFNHAHTEISLSFDNTPTVRSDLSQISAVFYPKSWYWGCIVYFLFLFPSSPLLSNPKTGSVSFFLVCFIFLEYLSDFACQYIVPGNEN